MMMQMYLEITIQMIQLVNLFLFYFYFYFYFYFIFIIIFIEEAFSNNKVYKSLHTAFQGPKKKYDIPQTTN